MAVVLGLMYFAARAMKNRGIAGPHRKRPVAQVELIARQGIGRTASVALVRTSGKVLVLGVTEANVSTTADASARARRRELIANPPARGSPGPRCRRL